MPYDYTDAPPPREIELIPDTVATCILHIRPGGVGEDGMLTRSKEGDCDMLDCEITVGDGEHKGRKFWQKLLLEGTTDGQLGMAEHYRKLIKKMLDSA